MSLRTKTTSQPVLPTFIQFVNKQRKGTSLWRDLTCTGRYNGVEPSPLRSGESSEICASGAGIGSGGGAPWSLERLISTVELETLCVHSLFLSEFSLSLALREISSPPGLGRKGVIRSRPLCVANENQETGCSPPSTASRTSCANQPKLINNLVGSANKINGARYLSGPPARSYLFGFNKFLMG